MNILITSGGTVEPIDAVRSISNNGTGRLGAKIADAFAASDKIEKIFYVCSMQAARPATDKAVIIPVQGTRGLEAALKEVSAQNTIDGVIHSMAVSDYRVKSVTTVGNLAQAAEGKSGSELEIAISSAESFDQSSKLSSSIPDLVVLLEQTPKIIASLRGLAPDAVIVGFKLLDHVPHEELMNVAYELMQKNDCDYVLANDNDTVNSDCHIGFLMDRERNEVTCTGKDAIAATIVETVIRKAESR